MWIRTQNNGNYTLKKGCEIYEMPQDEDVEVV